MSSIQQQSHREMLRRADCHQKQSRLIVDFYRIRRQLAYPLPVRETHFPQFPTRLGTWYPWDCWWSWAVEERVFSLGWAAKFGEHSGFAVPVEADLLGLAACKYENLEMTDGLGVAHIARVLATATHCWEWLADTTKRAIADGLSFLLARFSTWLDNERDWWHRRAVTPGHPDFANPLHNIHFIQTVGLCLAARAARHPSFAWLESHVQRFAMAVLDQHAAGVSEAVSYDGYVLDFLMDWAGGTPAELREAVLDHPELQEFLSQPAVVGAPGNLMQIAPLGDVEAVEMPFHASALAKWRRLRKSDSHDWQLSHFDPRMLRTDALAAIINGPELSGTSNPPTSSRTRAAIVLRSGNTLSDTAVAMSAHAAQMGHLHHDNGSIVIAAGGYWIISDPGYQQYMGTAEREFSIGPTAHNAVVINGQAQMKRAGRVTCEPSLINGIWQTSNDLRNCYDFPLIHCSRRLWLTDTQLVIVADEIAGFGLNQIAYHWHGHPDAAWWVDAGVAVVCLHNEQIWIRCMNCSLDESQVDRIRGSRGHLTLRAEIDARPHQVIWWAFGRDQASVRALSVNGSELQGHGTVFKAHTRN